jgi:predicted dehydrogenase
LGCGKIARVGHLPWLARHPGVEIVAVADPLEKNLALAARRWRVPRTFADPSALLDSGLVDAVAICSPPWAHREQAVAALERGLHVLCEKPLAPSVADAGAIAAAARRRPDLVFQAAFQKRFQPGFEAVREMVRGGALGQVFHVECSWHNWIPDFELPWMRRLFAIARRFGIDPARDLGAWRQLDPRGGGDFLDHGPHYFDLFRTWLGEVTHVSAHLRRLHPGFVGEDQANVLLKFESGATASLARSLNVVGRPHGAETGAVHGTAGSLFWRAPHEYTLRPVKLRRYGVANVIPNVATPVRYRGRRLASYRRQIEHFVRRIDGRSREALPLAPGLAASAEDGLRAIEIVEACRRASEACETLEVAPGAAPAPRG